MSKKEDKITNRWELRSGYSTGACAAAAAGAASLVLAGHQKPEKITISLPGGGEMEIPVHSVYCDGSEAVASVIKDAGDDPDVTDGLEIFARVELYGDEIVLSGGKGVGKVTKPGLAIKAGEYAINPVPRAMIIKEVQRVLGDGQGARVTIEAPGGEKLAANTLNPKLGIQDGISILGTTGIVRPMSDDAYIRSLVPQIDQVFALGYSYAVLTPGRMGENKAVSLGLPGEAIIQTSNYIGDLLEKSAEKGLRGVILFGHLGKLLKVAAGIFHTHSRLADARRETLAAHAAMAGAGQALVKKIMELNTAEESVSLLRENGLGDVYNSIAHAASERAVQFCSKDIKVGTVMYAFSGGVLGYDRQAEEMGGELGWRIE